MRGRMRCLYCDRSLGILRFRVTEPFCSLEHRNLHYRKSDPPLAHLLETNPHLIDRLTVPSMEEWIPQPPARQETTWPSQTLRYPEVAATGPLTKQFKVLTEIESRWDPHRPAPIEFSAVVYVVPPGDELLAPADLRVRISQTTDYSATLRFTLNSSVRHRAISSAGMYGPEPATVFANCPALFPFHERPVLRLEPEKELRGVRAVDTEGQDAISLSPARPTTPELLITRQAARAYALQIFPVVDSLKEIAHSKTDAVLEGPRNASANPSLPVARIPFADVCRSAACTLATHKSDCRPDSRITKLDPVRISPNSRLILGSPPGAVADSCKLHRSLEVPPQNEPKSPYPIISKEVTPRQARSASVFAVTFPPCGSIRTSTENTSRCRTPYLILQNT